MSEADNYFTAMERVEQQLDIVPTDKTKKDETVKVQANQKPFQLIARSEVPELCSEERMGITKQLRELFNIAQEHQLSSE